MVQGGAKPQKIGGLDPYERRAHYMNWVYRARKEFLLNHQGDIWKRYQEYGFILAIYGSENHKLHFRAGRYDCSCGSIFHFCEAKTTLTCQMSYL